VLIWTFHYPFTISPSRPSHLFSFHRLSLTFFALPFDHGYALFKCQNVRFIYDLWVLVPGASYTHSLRPPSLHLLLYRLTMHRSLLLLTSTPHPLSLPTVILVTLLRFASDFVFSI